MGGYRNRIRFVVLRPIRGQVQTRKADGRKLLHHLRCTSNHRLREPLADVRSAAIKRHVAPDRTLVLFQPPLSRMGVSQCRGLSRSHLAHVGSERMAGSGSRGVLLSLELAAKMD